MRNKHELKDVFTEIEDNFDPQRLDGVEPMTRLRENANRLETTKQKKECAPLISNMFMLSFHIFLLVCLISCAIIDVLEVFYPKGFLGRVEKKYARKLYFFSKPRIGWERRGMNVFFFERFGI